MEQKARITLFGIDDEEKHNSDSIYTTVINSTYFPAPRADSVKTIDGVTFTTKAAGFTTRKNTKRYKFTLNHHLKSLKLSNKAKLVIESITLPNILSESFLQPKNINNITLRMMGIPNHHIYDSSTKGKGSSVIFTSPVLLNTQGFGITAAATIQPDLLSKQQKPRLNGDNNGNLFINTAPNNLYSFKITDDFIRNGKFEFELIYDIGNCWKNASADNVFEYIPQTLDYTTDKDDLEAFMISFIIMDEPDDNEIYNSKALLNKINRLLLDKADK